jgi:hypothetical protein
VLQSDHTVGKELLSFIDRLSAAVGVNVKATDAWVLLDEMLEGHDGSDD